MPEHPSMLCAWLPWYRLSNSALSWYACHCLIQFKNSLVMF
jgi:hypothetical protein